jgi:hypothetical protein
MLNSLATADVWAVVVLVTAPTALVCGTVIVLVLAVGRKSRVEGSVTLRLPVRLPTTPLDEALGL